MDKLTNNAIKECKYKFKTLSFDSDEHKFVKNFYNSTFSTVYPQKFSEMASFDVYKIIESNPAVILKEKRNNLMLFHGTSSRRVKGILTEGFKNSENGFFGKGVYMTDCSPIAHEYSIGKYMTDCVGAAALYCGRFNENSYIFVNEVLKSESLKLIKHSRNERKFKRNSKPEHQFEKHVYGGSQQLTEKNFKEDTLGRKYRNVAVGEPDVYLADESLVVPRYLVVIGPTPMYLSQFTI